MTRRKKYKYLILALPFFPLISFFCNRLSHFFYLNLTSFISYHEFLMKILPWAQINNLAIYFFSNKSTMCHWPYIFHRGHGRTLSDGTMKCPHVICCGFTQDVLVTSSLRAGVGGGGSCSLLHPCCVWPRVGAQGKSVELSHNSGIYISFR